MRILFQRMLPSGKRGLSISWNAFSQMKDVSLKPYQKVVVSLEENVFLDVFRRNMFMSASCHSSDPLMLPWEDNEDPIGPHIRIINAHFQVSCKQSLDLHHLNDFVENGKVFQGRPTMLSCRILKSAIFPQRNNTNSRWRIESSFSSENEEGDSFGSVEVQLSDSYSADPVES